MTFNRIILATACIASLAGAVPASAQTYPQTVTGADGTRYMRLGPNYYGNDVGPATPGPGQYGSGVDANGRPIYRGVTGGNTTDTTGRQNPYARNAYNAQQAQADAAQSDANRRAEINRLLQQRAQIDAQRAAALRNYQR